MSQLEIYCALDLYTIILYYELINMRVYIDLEEKRNKG